MKRRPETGTALAFATSMGNLFLLLLAVSTTFAQDYRTENISPYVQNIEERYPKNKHIFLECLDKYPSRDKNNGCVDAFKYLRGLCELTHEYGFERKYKRINPHYFDKACEVAPLGDNRWNFFVELDQKACVRGFETTADRLKTFNENRDLLSELGELKYLYTYEKSSCQSLEGYVNFCSFVDGPRKNRLPSSDDMLAFPHIETGQDPEMLCKPTSAENVGQYSINYDLTAALQNEKQNVNLPMVNLIKQYRSRMASKKGSTYFACEQVRTDFYKYNCQRYAGLTEGEPVWRSERFMNEKRLQDAGLPVDNYQEQSSGSSSSSGTGR